MLIIFFICLGLVFGSFVAAYSYRYPLGIGISDGFSFCDTCKRKIMWYENIPVVSFLFLGGKCKTCGKRISFRYPLIEILTAVLFVLIFNIQGLSLNTGYSLLISLVLEMIFIIDFEHQVIPDVFVFVGIFVWFTKLLFVDQSILFSSIVSGFIGASFLVLIYIVTRGHGMGLGDVKFAVLGGMIVGVTNLFIWMLIAFLTGAIVGIILILGKNARLKDKIAFGPFLVSAIPLTFVFGPKILALMGIPL